MTCIVCHRSIGTRSRKCSVCGAPTALNKGEFLFEMNSADEKQLKTYYKKMQDANNSLEEASAASSAFVQTSIREEPDLQLSNQIYTNTPKINTSKYRISFLRHIAPCLLLALFTGFCATLAILSFVDIFGAGRLMTFILENTKLVWLLIGIWIFSVPSVWFTVKKMLSLSDSGLFNRGLLIWGMTITILISAIIVLVIYFRLPTLQEYSIEKYGFYI